MLAVSADIFGDKHAAEADCRNRQKAFGAGKQIDQKTVGKTFNDISAQKD